MHKSTSTLGNFIDVNRLVGTASGDVMKKGGDEKKSKEAAVVVESKLEFQRVLETKPEPKEETKVSVGLDHSFN